MSQEIELKLALPARALPALRRHPLVQSATRIGNAVTLDNTYYDTPRLQLKARKVAVRTRRQGRLWLQTVKCAAQSSGGLSQRPEWEQPYSGSFDFSAVDEPVAARLLARHHDHLVPVFTTRFRRETRRHQPREGVSILLMIDTGTIALTTPEGVERSAPICELELELEHGSPADLLELACMLAQTLPLMPADQSKAERGYRLFLDTPVEPARAETVAIRDDQNVIDAFRDLALACVRQWQSNAILALDAEQHDAQLPDFIHQLRVALRRLRALLKIFGPALPEAFVRDWNLRLRDNANRFGDARDLDVFQAELLAPIQPEGLAEPGSLEHLMNVAAEARRRAHTSANAALDRSTQGSLLLAFMAGLLQLQTNSLTAAVDLRTFARLRLRSLRKRVRRQYAAAAELEPTRLHTLRIGIKQLRYGIEFFSTLFPERKVRPYLGAVIKAQNALGFLQDVDIARLRLTDWAAATPELRPAASFVMGWNAPRYARVRTRVLKICEPLLWGQTPW